METVVLVIHVMIAIVLIALVLLQRSEGGALGIGGGGPGGLVSARGAANLLTRATAVLAAGFMLTSILLTVFAAQSRNPKSFVDQAPPAAEQPAPTKEPQLPEVPQVPTPQN